MNKHTQRRYDKIKTFLEEKTLTALPKAFIYHDFHQKRVGSRYSGSL